MCRSVHVLLRLWFHKDRRNKTCTDLHIKPAHTLSSSFVNEIAFPSTYTDTDGYKKKVKSSRYRPGVSQTVGTGIALLFYVCGTRRWGVVSSTPRPHFTPGKDQVPILQEAGWTTPVPVWTSGKSRPHRDSIPDRIAHSQSLYRLSYAAHGGYTVSY